MGMRNATNVAQYHCPEFPARLVYLLGGPWNGSVTTSIRFPHLTRLTLDIGGLFRSAGEGLIEELATRMVHADGLSGVTTLCIRGLDKFVQSDLAAKFGINLITACQSLKKLDIDAHEKDYHNYLFETVCVAKNLEALQMVSEFLFNGYGCLAGVLPKLESRDSLTTFSLLGCRITQRDVTHSLHDNGGTDVSSSWS